MAIIYADQAGSNTAPYDTWAKAATSIQTAVDALSNNGDIIIIGSGTWVIATGITTANISLLANASFVIKSAIPGLCILSSNQANAEILKPNEATFKYNIDFQGIDFTKSVTHTDVATAAFLSITGAGGNVSFYNCNVYNMTVNYGVATSGTGPIIRCANSVRTLSLIDTVISDINVTAIAETPGLLGTGVNTSLVCTRLTVKNITVSISGLNAGMPGMFYCRNTVTVQDFIGDNITATNTGTGTANVYGFFYCQSITQTASIDGATVTGFIWTGGGSGAFFCAFTGPYIANRFNVSNCSIIDPTVLFVNGGVILALGDTAQGTFTNSVVHDCIGHFGIAYFASQGGGGTVNNILAYNNAAIGINVVGGAGGGGAIYCGGWGDVNISNSIFYSNTADEGGAVYAHIHAAATRAKTVKIYNCTFYGNKVTKQFGGLGGEAIIAKGANATLLHTVEVKNNICWDDGIDEIYGYAAGAGLSLTVDHCNINGGQAATTLVNIYTDNINANPEFDDQTNNRFSLKVSSPSKSKATNLGDTYKLGLNKASIWPDGIMQIDRSNHTWDQGAYVSDAKTKKRKLILAGV